MKNKGFSQILLIIGILAVFGVAFYVYQTRFTEPLPVIPPTAKVETVDQSISSLDSDFSENSVSEEDLGSKDLQDLEKDLNDINLSQI